MIRFLILVSIVFIATSSQAQLNKIAKESIEEVSKSRSVQKYLLKFFPKSSKQISKELIEEYSFEYAKNYSNKVVKISGAQIKSLLLDVEKYLGTDELIKVGEKLSLLSGGSQSTLKGYIAEIMSHVSLYKNPYISNVLRGVRGTTSPFIREIIGQNYGPYFSQYQHLKIDKIFEVDFIFQSKGLKYILEVKNIDSAISPSKFEGYFKQGLKQVAYAKENGIKNVFWSNIGETMLNEKQLFRMREIGIIVLQHGSTSPVINQNRNFSKLNSLL